MLNYTWARHLFLAPSRRLVPLLALILAACGSPNKDVRAAIHTYNEMGAEGEQMLDDFLRSANGSRCVPVDQWDFEDGNVVRVALEKGMMRFVEGDYETAIKILSRLRETVDERRIDSLEEYMGLDGFSLGVKTIALGDQGDTFRPSDYEHLMLCFTLTLAEIMTNGSDQLAYANQFDLAQKRVLESDYGVTEANAKQDHQCLAIGSYLEGLLKEERNPSNARFAYEEALRVSPQSVLIQEAVARTGELGIEDSPRGTLHVFYFLGAGPLRESTRWDFKEADPLLEVAVRILAVALEKISAEIAGELFNWDDAALAALVQLPVPVPRVVRSPEPIPSVQVRIEEEAVLVAAEPMLDVNALAEKDIEAARLRLLARALLRRGLKAVIARQVLGGGAASTIGNLMSQVTERADDRCWGALPAEIHVARIDLPVGHHSVDFGCGAKTRSVHIEPGRHSFAIVHRRSTNQGVRVHVDRHSARVPVKLQRVRSGAVEAASSSEGQQ